MIVARVPPMYSACTDRPLPAVGEGEDEAEHDQRDEEQRDPQRRRHHPGRAVDPVLPGQLPGRGLLEPLVVARLLDRGLELTPCSVLNMAGPQGLSCSSSVPSSICSHSTLTTQRA